jgi:glycosyltransferase involved in cell wall biosynthesis
MTAAAVSVIIPTRNSLRWLPHAIGSIGDDPRAEILVVDDASTDGTRNWLVRKSLDEPRLRILQGQGAGLARARNLAIAAATAPLLAFLDACDSWYPGKLPVQLRLHQDHPQLAFSFTDYRRVNEQGLDFGSWLASCPDHATRYARRDLPFMLGEDALAQILAEAIVGTSTVVARTELVRQAGGFDPDLPAAENRDLWLRLSRRGMVMCVPEVLAEELVRPADDPMGLRRARVLGMRMIAARHGALARRQDPHAEVVFSAQLLKAEAEVAEAAGHNWISVGLWLRAWLLQPTRSAAREWLAALRRALG